MGTRLTVGEAEDVIIPEDTILRAVVKEVKPRTIEWRDKQTGEQKSRGMMSFLFEITTDGPYKGNFVRGEVNDKFTIDSTSQLRNWCMSLLQRELPPGMGIDTDDLLGMPADITVRHREAKDKSRIFMEVDQVMSIDGAFEMSQQAPPF